jgi:DNA-binding transcriptional ArsR family regulator
VTVSRGRPVLDAAKPESARLAPAERRSAQRRRVALGAELAACVASRLGALAHPVRVGAIGLLAVRALTVSEAASALGVPANLMSKHLRELYRAGVVWRRREGSFVRYGLCDPDLARAMLLVARSLNRAVS